jgi:NADPH-dependent 2,4-dienoyl-CoA reductase/sulfur reductase-like enzyme
VDAFLVRMPSGVRYWTVVDDEPRPASAAEVIAKWLADTACRVLVVGTYDSAHRLAEALRRAGQVAELTVCDEAHRLAGAVGNATAAILVPDVMLERRRPRPTPASRA